MTETWQEWVCNETTGFLFKHDCLRPATTHCALCAKPLCADHVRTLPEERPACAACARLSGGRTSDYDDPFYESRTYYPGYGTRSSHHHSHRDHDPDDLTPADAESLAVEGDEDFETDMGAS